METLGVFKPLTEWGQNMPIPPTPLPIFMAWVHYCFHKWLRPVYIQESRRLADKLSTKTVLSPPAYIQESRLWMNRRRLLLFAILQKLG